MRGRERSVRALRTRGTCRNIFNRAIAAACVHTGTLREPVQQDRAGTCASGLHANAPARAYLERAGPQRVRARTRVPRNSCPVAKRASNYFKSPAASSFFLPLPKPGITIPAAPPGNGNSVSRSSQGTMLIPVSGNGNNCPSEGALGKW